MTAAAQLIEAGGDEGFSLREAARVVGVSANAAYRHFADKSALLTAVAGSGFNRLSRRMQEAMSAVDTASGDGPGVARLKAVARAYVDLALESPAMFRLMFGANGMCALDQEKSALEGPAPGDLLGQALDELVAEGRLSPEQRRGAELRAWSVVHGFASLAIDGPAARWTTAQRTAAREDLLDFTVTGLGVSRRPPPPRRGRAQKK